MIDDYSNLNKIRSPVLKESATKEAPQTHVVLVQLISGSERFVDLSETESGYLRPREVVQRPTGSPRKSFTDMAKKIERVVGRRALSKLPTSDTLVIEASGSELRKIALLPEIEAIYLNEKPR